MPVAQLVEHLTFNQGAWGSNPQWVTIWGVRVWRNGRRGRLRICCLWRMSSSLFTRTIICGSSSVVECHLAKVDVASPNLVYRSTVAPWPSGKAKLCKSFILQFDSGWRLQMKTQTVVWVFSYGRMRQSVACTRKRGFDRPSFFVCGGQRTAIEQASIRWV